MNDCLFCRIVAGEIPSSKVYEDDTVYAFRDINPMAPVHILIVPKAHLTSAADITADNAALVAHITCWAEQKWQTGWRNGSAYRRRIQDFSAARERQGSRRAPLTGCAAPRCRIACPPRDPWRMSCGGAHRPR